MNLSERRGIKFKRCLNFKKFIFEVFEMKHQQLVAISDMSGRGELAGPRFEAKKSVDAWVLERLSDLQTYKFFLLDGVEFEWKRSEGILTREGAPFLEDVTALAVHPIFPQVVAVAQKDRFRIMNFRSFSDFGLEGKEPPRLLELDGFIYNLKFKNALLLVQVLVEGKSDSSLVYNWMDQEFLSE